MESNELMRMRSLFTSLTTERLRMLKQDYTDNPHLVEEVTMITDILTDRVLFEAQFPAGGPDIPM